MKIQYVRAYGLFIPKLENRPMGVNLPLINYATGDVLPPEEQILEVTDKEGTALINSGNFVSLEVIPPVVEAPVLPQVNVSDTNVIDTSSTDSKVKSTSKKAPVSDAQYTENTEPVQSDVVTQPQDEVSKEGDTNGQ